MNTPSLSLVLVALPFLAAALIVGVSSARRRQRAAAPGCTTEPVHRLQADTAAVQDAVSRPPSGVRRLVPGRERRAAAVRSAAGR